MTDGGFTPIGWIDGHWEIVVIGGEIDGAEGMMLAMPHPPQELLFGRCVRPQDCQANLAAEDHPHGWYWFVGEQRKPISARRYRLLSAENGMARYADATVDLT